MDSQFFDEAQSRNGFSNSFVIFVSGVMKGYIITIIIINTWCDNDRSVEVAADVFSCDVMSAEICLCTNVKTVRVFWGDLVFSFMKSWTNTGRELRKQYFSKEIAEKIIIKVFDRMSGSGIIDTTLGDEGMNVRIPL